MTARSWRRGGPTTRSGRTASSFVELAYWRLMNTITSTRIGMITATRSEGGAFSTVTTTATIPVSTQPRALIARRHCQRLPRTLRQWRTMPPWLSVKETNTPTE